MFDIFYSVKVAELPAHAQPAVSEADAASRAKTRMFWYIEKHVDLSSWDWLWEPVPWEAHQKHVWGSPKDPDKGLALVPRRGHTDTNYHRETLLARRDPYWEVPDGIDASTFDFSWHPSSYESPFIHVFGTQWQRTGGPVYRAPGATEVKFESDTRATALPTTEHWEVPDGIDASTFDFSWHPDRTDPPFIYCFGTQWQRSGGPRYVVPGATAEKFELDIRATALPTTEHWEVPDGIDVSAFDFSWHPDVNDPPFIYQFGTQWQRTGGPVYRAPGATEVKFVEDIRATALPTTEHWEVPDGVDVSAFDFSWHPDRTDPPYIYCFGTQWQRSGGPVYRTPGATKTKFVEDIRATALPTTEHWEVPDGVDVSTFDFSWHPDRTDPPFIYCFGTQWQRTGGPVYRTPGATKTKFVEDIRATALPTTEHWEVPDGVDVSTFDFSWHPDVNDPPFIYQFGTQWQRTGGPVYRAPGATEVKFVEDIRATALPTSTQWEVPDGVDVSTFDFSWHPDVNDPPFIYQFGTQWQRSGGPRYVVPGATAEKFIDDIRATAASHLLPKYTITTSLEDLVAEHPTERFWALLPDVDVSTFDFSWHPDVNDPPYIYCFGTQWQRTGGPVYRAPGATEVKFVEDIRATALPTTEHWEVPDGVDVSAFDFSWHPNSTDPPYIYCFGTQWQRTGGPVYRTPGATKTKFIDDIRATAASYLLPKYTITTTLEDLVAEHPTERFWALNKEMDYTGFDFSWHPDRTQEDFVHVFGTEWQKHSHTYLVNAPAFLRGHTDLNFVADIQVKSGASLDIFFVDRYNKEAAARFERLRQRYPHAQKTRFFGDWMSTINRLASKAQSDKFWVISSELDYTTFDFSWHPEPWQSSMFHVFPTRWQQWSDTFMVNRWEFAHCATWCERVEDLPKLNFVSDQVVDVPATIATIFVIDAGNAEAATVRSTIEAAFNVIKHTRFFGSYLETFQRILPEVPEGVEAVWVVSTLCDYRGFDFTWQPSPWQRAMLHVFPSDDQAFGDTFFVPVDALRACIDQLDMLEWFETVHYAEDQQVPRWPLPVVHHSGDSIVPLLPTAEGAGPLLLISTDPAPTRVPAVSVWDTKKLTVCPLNRSGSTTIVPRAAIPAAQTQLYDYPYIDRSHNTTASDRPLDIVFIANGEPGADRNWDRLQAITAGQPNKIHRIDSVKGRVAAYQAAAGVSTTPWFFAVFAKLYASEQFDWQWQADCLQAPKHYIFHAQNPVNGLEYGHQAMIAYHRELVLVNPGLGLDFTLDQAHEVVPVLSGIAEYNTDPWTTWRTAFRETLKLQQFATVSKDYAVRARLRAWTGPGVGSNAEWSQRGALDAVAYYAAVQGDAALLQLSYEWEWLQGYFEERYHSITNPLNLVVG